MVTRPSEITSHSPAPDWVIVTEPVNGPVDAGGCVVLP